MIIIIISYTKKVFAVKKNDRKILKYIKNILTIYPKYLKNSPAGVQPVKLESTKIKYLSE